MRKWFIDWNTISFRLSKEEDVYGLYEIFKPPLVESLNTRGWCRVIEISRDSLFCDWKEEYSLGESCIENKTIFLDFLRGKVNLYENVLKEKRILKSTKIRLIDKMREGIEARNWRKYFIYKGEIKLDILVNKRIKINKLKRLLAKLFKNMKYREETTFYSISYFAEVGGV